MINEIKKTLRNNSSKKTKKSIKKMIPSAKNIYGVKTPILNEIAKNYTKEKENINNKFKLIEVLWKSDNFEEKLLATKILGRICDKDPNKTIKLLRKFSKNIDNWAVCDTLATQGIKKIKQEKKKEILDISKELINKNNFWEKRFAIVLLINFVDEKYLERDIKYVLGKITKPDEEHHYVKKAVEWLKREINRN